MDKIKPGHCRECGLIKLKYKYVGIDKELSRGGSEELDEVLIDTNYQESLGSNFHMGAHCQCEK